MIWNFSCEGLDFRDKEPEWGCKMNELSIHRLLASLILSLGSAPPLEGCTLLFGKHSCRIETGR